VSSVLESRINLTPAVLKYMDSMMGFLLSGGFSGGPHPLRDAYKSAESRFQIRRGRDAAKSNRRLVPVCRCPQNASVFTSADRDRIRDQVLGMASSDARIVAGAVLGSLAYDDGDRWSDLDLMFAVVDEVPVTDVLEDWSHTVVQELGGVPLFDLPSGPIIY
jgi:hypothetical protein